jgi:hypothetical protein
MDKLMLKLDSRKTGEPRNLISFYFAPLQRVRRIRAVGPYGSSILARIMDLTSVVTSGLYCRILDAIITGTRQLTGEPPVTPRSVRVFFQDIVGLSKFKDLRKYALRYTYSIKLRHIIEQRAKARLSLFVDGLGK